MSSTITKPFEAMGAKVEVKDRPRVNEVSLSLWGRRGGFTQPNAAVRINILKDHRGREYFDIQRRIGTRLDVLDVRPKDRHLLLLAKSDDGTKSRFLCGHDERSWFVAAIPEEARGVTGVQSAKEALKPPEVIRAQVAKAVPMRKRQQRRNEAYIRQGEWFFIPVNRPDIRDVQTLQNEPIRRGSGKPHMCQQLYREGGTTVHVRSDYPNGLTNAEYQKLDEKVKADKRHGGLGAWRLMQRDAAVYVRGRISHPDHKTIDLQGWHQVVMNTETKARAMREVAFLD